MDFLKQAELQKLSRLLNLSLEQLAYLNDQTGEDLKALRIEISKKQFEGHHQLFRRLGTISKMVPAILSAKIAQIAFGTLLCARVAVEMPVDKALDIVGHLPTDFLADMCVYLDPARLRPILSELKIKDALRVGNTLIPRREYIVMANFVDNMPLKTIMAILNEVDDGEALLHIGFYVENQAILNDILAGLSTQKLEAIISAAANPDADLWPEALALMGAVDPQWQKQLVNLAASGSEDVLASMISAIAKRDWWAMTLPLINLIEHENKKRLVNINAVQKDDVIKQILLTAENEKMWPLLLPLVGLMEPQHIERVACCADVMSNSAFEQVISVTRESKAWATTLPLVANMKPATQARVSQLIEANTDSDFDALFDSIETADDWAILLKLLPNLSPELQQRLANWPTLNSAQAQHQIVTAAQRHNLWENLVPLLSAVAPANRASWAHAFNTAPPDALAGLIDAVNNAHAWETAFDYFEAMDAPHQSTIILWISDLSEPEFITLFNEIDKAQLWPKLSSVLIQLPPNLKQNLFLKMQSLDTALKANLLRLAFNKGILEEYARHAELIPPSLIESELEQLKSHDPELYKHVAFFLEPRN